MIRDGRTGVPACLATIALSPMHLSLPVLELCVQPDALKASDFHYAHLPDIPVAFGLKSLTAADLEEGRRRDLGHYLMCIMLSSCVLHLCFALSSQSPSMPAGSTWQ